MLIGMKKIKEVSKYNFARDIIFASALWCILSVQIVIILICLPIQVVRFILDSLFRIMEKLEDLIIGACKKIEKKYFKKD